MPLVITVVRRTPGFKQVFDCVSCEALLRSGDPSRAGLSVVAAAVAAAGRVRPADREAVAHGESGGLVRTGVLDIEPVFDSNTSSTRLSR
ncbi:hypothetical protein GCM10027194_11510 [Thalassiella azotivora]